jgi:GT2 family glycosyltransferase/glycosyltransferase involved in cell wall biosynthesis
VSQNPSATRAIEPLVCILGNAAAAWRDAVRSALPDAATLVELDATDKPAAMRELAQRHPQRDLILLEAGTLLPPHWHARLCAGLAVHDALAVEPLTPRWLAGTAAPTDAAALAKLDARCHVFGSRAALDTASLDAPLLALRAEATALLASDGAKFDLATLPAPWRALRMEDLLVARAREDGAREDDVHNPHLALADTLAAVADTAPGYPGLDGKPVLLHVLHGWGGGAARWVADYAAADAQHHHLVLEAHGSFKRRRHGETFELHLAGGASPPLRRFAPTAPITSTAISHAGYVAFLREVLTDFAVDAVVVSSLIGHSLDALATGLPTTLAVHDHYPLWPLLHRDFGDMSLRFDDAQLDADLAAEGEGFEFAERDAAHWRTLRKAFVGALRNAHAALIAPSRSALDAELRLAPELAALPQRVIPHGIAPWPPHAPLPVPPPRTRLRLVVPGRVRKGKGAELLRTALPDLREHAELILLGAGAEGMDFFGERDVHVVLDYKRDELPALLANFAPDAALILPTVAETFGYTLSELRGLGVPVIATRVGALAERITDGIDGFLVAPEAAAVVARVAALSADRAAIGCVRDGLRHVQETNLDAMAAAWNAALDLPEKVAPRYVPREVDNAETEARRQHNALLQLQRELRRRDATLAVQQAEIERRGEWGWKLDREQRKAAARVEQLHGELDDRTAWALSLDAEVQRVKPQLEQMLASRSWRLTRPLRNATTRYRELRSTLAFRLARLRSLRGRMRGSLGRRGVFGTLQRIRQEFDQRQPATTIYAHPQPDDAFTPFALPASDAPRVSIVIPVHNKVEYTVASLRSLAEHAGATPFEAIVVDDASSDATAGRLAQIDNLRVLRNDENLGFIGSCNRGATASRGEFVLFLNNDTLVTAGWLEALLGCFAERANAGLVGARLIYPDGRLQEAGGIVFNDGSGWNYGRFEHPDDPRFNFRRRADYCSGAAILLRRELFDKLGGFDTRYAPAYYEDTDLAFAVRAAGYEVYVEPRAEVVHFEGITSGTDTTSGIKRHQVVNRDKFVEKWSAALARQPAPISDARQAHLAATHRAKKRVLIVDASTPTPDQDSGSLRLLNIMRLLRDMDCQVSFLPDNLARFEKYTPLLQAEGIEALYHPFVADLPAFYRARGREFDLVMVSRHYVAAHHLGLVRAYAPQARLAFDTVDLHYLRERRAAELDPRAELKRQADATCAQELKLIRECDVTLVVSRVERELLAHDAPGARVEILSNVHAIRGCRAGYDARHDLLFVGGFQHPPNIDAMLWFCGEVLPLVRKDLPDVKLHIVGSKVTPAIQALASDAVVVHGFVEDIEPLLDGCRISVAPLRYGAGVKGKVNSAMSHGLPVVATPMAVEGIDARDGEEVLVGGDAAAFAAQVVRLYRDPELWARLSRNGLDNVRRQFSFDTARETLQRLLS